MNPKEKLDQQLDGTTPRQVAPPNDPAAPHPKKAEAMAIFERVTKMRKQGIGVDIRQIANQLSPKPINTRFPERLFVDHFLPMFTGEVPETIEINQRTWIDKIAGGEMRAVDVVNDKDEVLFTVPAFLNASGLETIKPGNVIMSQVERHYSRLKEVDAAGSQVFLTRTLESMHIRATPPEDLFENLKTWNAIFERYGKQDKIINLGNLLDHDPNKNKSSSSGTSANADVGDYDLDVD